MGDPRDGLRQAAVLPLGWVLAERSDTSMQLSVIFRRNRRAGPSILSVAATIDGAWLLARIAAIDAEARERSWW